MNDSRSTIAEDSGNRTISFKFKQRQTLCPTNESGQTLTITNGSAVGGSVSIVGSDVTFSPTLNFNGAASFVYTLPTTAHRRRRQRFQDRHRDGQLYNHRSERRSERRDQCRAVLYWSRHAHDLASLATG